MEPFMESLQAAVAAQNVYVAALPQWVQLWMNWMAVCLFLGSLVFAIFKTEARWLLLANLILIVATMALGMTIGWNGLWGSTHLLIWTPVVIYFIRRWPMIEKRSIYGVWFVLALATMIISLIFDAKDVAQYLLAV